MRFVDTELERPRWRLTLGYRVSPTLQVGMEANPAAHELGPLFTWYLQTEDEKRPALFLGTSSDRIGTPKGDQAYYLTLAKQIPRTPFAPYFSVNYSEFDRKVNFPFGVNISLNKRWSLLPMYDGQRSHLLFNYTTDRYGVTLIYAWYERFGVSFSAGLK